MDESKKLHNLIKYCTDYINLTNPSLSRYKKVTEFLEAYIDIRELFNPNKEKILINFDTFYSYNPKEVPDRLIETYKKEKDLLEVIQDYWSKYQINPYTKELYLQFCFFKVEYSESLLVDDGVDPGLEIAAEKSTVTERLKNITSDEPLFVIPINIIQENHKYYVKLADEKVIPHLSVVNKLLKEREDLYIELLQKVNDFEMGGKFELPLSQDLLTNFWSELKSRLKHADITFDETSFQLLKTRIILQPKSNYFLAEDLKKLQELVKKSDKSVMNSSLGSWYIDDELYEESSVPNEDSSDLYFPFPTNESQRDVLKHISNKVSIVQGPPGTGKSTTIANILTHLAANGKSVLFVSQKPQALKVVKDQLKKLENDLLFGYIPDPNSYICTEEDLNDSIANKIAGVSQVINTYINLYEYYSRKGTNKLSVGSIKETYHHAFKEHKRYFHAITKLNGLKEFNLRINHGVKFSTHFTEQNWHNLESLRKDIEKLTKEYKKLQEDKTIPRKQYLIEFGSIEYNNNLVSAIHSAYLIIEKKLIDRPGFINQIINSYTKQFHLEKALSATPREVYNKIIKLITSKSIYKTQVLNQTLQLRDYCQEKYLEATLPILHKQLLDNIIKFGIDAYTYGDLRKLILKYGFEKTLKGINEIRSISETIQNIDIVNLNTEHTKLLAAKLSNFQRIRYYLINILVNNAKNKLNNAHNNGLLQQISRAYKKSKKAYRTFDRLKQNTDVFPFLRSIIPIWIMSLEDASRLLPLTQALFDYVIIDEASQCNIAYTLPVMYRTNKILFVGDTYQMRDSTYIFKSNRMMEEMSRKYNIPDLFQIKSTDDSIKSVLDIGRLRGFKEVYLKFHYRSPKELIGFSNKYIYTPNNQRLYVLNSNYCFYSDTNRVLVNHVVQSNKLLDTSDKTNFSEVIKIKELIRELQTTTATMGKSIGVLTFFNEQAELLRREIKDTDIKIGTIEGIQGDEKDIIIFSFVITETKQKNKYIALTGENGEIRRDIAQGRINVAFSRARLQVHCVTSLRVEDWPEGIWIKKYLKYVDKEGEVKHIQPDLKPFDSNFEKDVADHLLGFFDKSKFILYNQFPSCGYRIDFVLTNRSTGKRLAIECDGPTHFENEMSEESFRTDSDIDRQLILESAGWEFYRIPYFFWDNNKSQVIDEINNIFIKYEHYLKIQQEKKADQLRKESIELKTQAKKHSEIIKEKSSETQEALPLDLDVNTKPASNNLNLSNNNQKTKNFATEDFVKKIHSKTDAKIGLVEAFRIVLNSEDTLIASTHIENQKHLFYVFVNTPEYKGFTQKGFTIDHDFLKEFIKFLRKFNSDRIEMQFNFQNNETRYLKVSQIGESVDIRVFLHTSSYTGHTKHGFRMKNKQFKEFLDKLNLIYR